MKKVISKWALLSVVSIIIIAVTQPVISDKSNRNNSGQEPVTFSTDQYYEAFWRLHQRFDYLEIKDKKGNLKYRFQQIDNVSTENGKRHFTGTKIFASRKYLFVTNYDKKETSTDEYFKTGIPDRSNNEINLYDNEGNVIFHQKNVPYDLKAISGNGKVVACVISVPILDSESKVSFVVNKIPPLSEIFVFSVEGKQIYHATEAGISNSVFSPSGNFLAYECSCRKTDVKIVDLKMNHEYLVPFGQNEDSFDAITDEGVMFRVDKKQLGFNSDGSDMTSEPTTIILYKLVK